MKNQLQQFTGMYAIIVFALFLVLSVSFPEVKGQSKNNLTSEQLQAVEAQKALEVKYNVNHGDPVYVEWEKMPRETFEKGKVRIKLMPFMHKSMDSEYLLADKEAGYVKTGNASLDNINKSIGAVEYLRRQDALYRVSPASHKYRERHMAYGSHLFREISFDAKLDVVEVVRMFEALPEVELAEPVGIKVPIKPTDIKPLEIQEPNEGAKWAPNDPFYPGNQWHYENYGQTVQGQVGVAGWDVNAEAAWDIEKGNPSFITAIVDGGVQFDHPDIAANMWPTIGPDGNGTVEDDHGTHVAGTISAVTNNGVGVAGLAGGDGSAGSGSLIMSIDLFAGSHGLSVTGMFQYAADNGASISQNSWGYGAAGSNYADDRNAIDYFNDNGGGAGLNGGIVIFAAGNDNDNGDWYPAYYGYGLPDKLGAMAVAGHDNRGIRYNMSNYGPWIDITAPAVNVASTASAGAYLFMTGTSMACPHVSGAAALIVANTEGVLTNVELWAILKESVRTDLYTLNPGYIGELGTGALDAAAALVEAQTYLGGVPNAINFTAEAISDSEIDLSWGLNTHSDEVIVAWVLDGNEFGTPVNGNVYNVGNTIPGGGAVIYKGTAAAFSHTGLNPVSTYKYRIWAIAAEERQDDQGEWYQQGDYSTGKSSSATTYCSIYTLPFSDGFEGGVDCWWTAAHTGADNWTMADTGSQSGTYHMSFNATAAGNSAYLLTPQLAMQGYTTLTLTFFERRARVWGQFDQLEVGYYNGQEIFVLQTYTARQAAWIERTINIPTANITAESFIFFRPIGTVNARTQIDNVSITGAGPVVYADFSGTPRTVDIDETVTFTDLSGGGTITSWSWDFGAGAVPATATGQGPHTVSYSTAGAKTVALTVNGTQTATKADYIVVLSNPILSPRNLAHTLNTNDVALTWKTPLIDDSFETYQDFALDFGNWTQHDIDGSATYGIDGVTYTNSGYTGAFMLFNNTTTNPPLNAAWAGYSGSKSAICFAATAGPNNDWIISPAVSIEAGHSLSFMHKSITDAYGLERFRVGISTTGTAVGDFTIITPGAYLESPLAWTEYTYDLSAYAGQEIHIAIHCVSDDAFAFLVDDFKVKDGAKSTLSLFEQEKPVNNGLDIIKSTNFVDDSIEYKKAKLTGESPIATFTDKSHGGYKVYRNEIEIASLTGEKSLTHNDNGLANGTYYYTITTMYQNPVIESAPSNEIEVIIGTAVTPGDVNDDGFINVLDVVWMIRHINGDTPVGFNMAAGDVTQTGGAITTADLVALIDLIYAGAKDFDDNINSEQSYMMLDNNGLVSFDSDGTYSALQFEFISGVNEDMNPELLLNTDHKLSFNNETGKGIIYSMNNSLIPAGKYDLFSIEGVDADNIEWGFSLAANLNYEAIEIITAKEGEDATSIDGIEDSALEISVFPNPNTGNFNVKVILPNAAYLEMMLVDERGRIVTKTQRSYYPDGEHNVQYNSEQALNNGIYIVRVNTYGVDGQKLDVVHEEKIMIIK